MNYSINNFFEKSYSNKKCFVASKTGLVFVSGCFYGWNFFCWKSSFLDVSSLAIAAFQKLYNIFFWNCSSLAKNTNNFVSPNLTIHNWYCLSAVAILNPPDVKYKFQHCSMCQCLHFTVGALIIRFFGEIWVIS